MKMKKIILIAALAIFFFTGYNIGKNKAVKKIQETFYPQTTVVSRVNYESDTVICLDNNGHIWKFSGCEDWEVGDICSMIVNTNGTSIIYDDEIIRIRYNGGTENMSKAMLAQQLASLF